MDDLILQVRQKFSRSAEMTGRKNAADLSTDGYHAMLHRLSDRCTAAGFGYTVGFGVRKWGVFIL